MTLPGRFRGASRGGAARRVLLSTDPFIDGVTAAADADARLLEFAQDAGVAPSRLAADPLAALHQSVTFCRRYGDTLGQLGAEDFVLDFEVLNLGQQFALRAAAQNGMRGWKKRAIG